MSGMSVSAWGRGSRARRAPEGRALGGRLAPAARLLVCAVLPWYLCVWLGTSTAPVPAALPAVLILRDDVFAAPRMALDRLVGVVVGVLVSVAVLHWLPAGRPLSFPVLMVCATAGMYLLRRGGSPNQQVLVSALVIYSTPVAGYPLARLEESAVGIAVVALLGPLLWPPDPFREAAAGLEAYRLALGARLERLAAHAAAGSAAPGPAGLVNPSPLWHRAHEVSAVLDRRTGRTLLLPPRRPAPGRSATLRARLRLAARTAPALLFLARELEARTPDPAVRALAPAIGASARAVDLALRGEEHTAALERALALEAEHRAAHPARRDVVLRAGLGLTHAVLAEHPVAAPSGCRPEGPPGHPPQGPPGHPPEEPAPPTG
ncbi:FUSC family protein [Streptomyces sp. NPDC048606]|uniref:FUSC family protein n=1 Tax=Streptomyces sp. NPDC048606 TaxID=3154726 RepID=UPI00343CD3CF